MEQIFNKLVRDNIPKIITRNGELAVTRVLDDEEYRSELYKKLLEETNELIVSKTKEELVEELADIYEVLKSITLLEGINIEEVIDVSNIKRLKRGGFEKRIFLEKTY